MRGSGSDFDTLVAQALDELPPQFARWVAEVDVRVEDWPSATQMASAGVGHPSELMGLYEGVPRTERTSDFGMVLPDRITLFRAPILSVCRTPAEVREEVRRTVLHEIAHHFGIDDDRLTELGAY
jgi:predicted Zn-dependent protease with MMP-like domain